MSAAPIMFIDSTQYVCARALQMALALRILRPYCILTSTSSPSLQMIVPLQLIPPLSITSFLAEMSTAWFLSRPKARQRCDGFNQGFRRTRTEHASIHMAIMPKLADEGIGQRAFPKFKFVGGEIPYRFSGHEN